MKSIKLLTMLALFALPLMLFADDKSGHGESHEHATTTAKAHDTAGDTKTLQGKIIGLTCYLKHDAIGESHKKCAKECAEKGLPLALLTDDGQLYQIMGKGHEELKKVNASLLAYIEEEVTVVGETYSKHGMNSITIEKIKKK